MYIPIILGLGISFYCTILAVKVARQRNLKCGYRWFVSLALIGMPLIGLLVYFLVRGSMASKSHVYFSDAFVERLRDYP